MKDARSSEIAYFLSFCIEQYKQAHSLNGADAMRLLADRGVLEYLMDNYEAFHTQSHHWLIEEMDELIATRQAL